MGGRSKQLQVAVKPELLRWARERAGCTIHFLQTQKRFLNYALWESGEYQPTLKQLERLAKVLYVPIGFLFLSAPPEEPLPIPDFRTARGAPQRPSPNLLDTIYLCQQRQEWYRGYLQTMGTAPLPFVGSVTIEDDPIEVAANIRRRLAFDIEERGRIRTWMEALQRFMAQVDTTGILVMSSSIVGNNAHRKLDTKEFRGFALVDDLAPVIFINAADTKAAQMFTLAHEIAHVWIWETGISDVQVSIFPDEQVEKWCNQVAVEVLVPIAAFRQLYQPGEPLREALDRLARYFKVSSLVILRRIHEIGALSQEKFWQAYKEELDYLEQFRRPSEGGGDFYRTLCARVSTTFAQAVILSVLEGQTLFRDAYQMMGIHKPETFRRFAETLGVG